MQNKDFNIAIIEDNSLVSLDLEDRLESLGFTKLTVFTSGEDFIESLDTLKPKVVLMDIELAGTLDGIETTIEIKKKYDVAVIYLTDHVDDETFQRALSSSPVAFLHKPFVDKQIAQNIEIAASQENELSLPDSSILVPDGLFAFESEGHYKKILFREIQLLKADRAYCKIELKNKTLTISRSMKAVLSLLSRSKEKDQFIQVHRSYVINKAFIAGFNGRTLLIGKYSVPTTEYYIPDLKARFFTI